MGSKAGCVGVCVKSKQGEAREKTLFLKEEEDYLSFVTELFFWCFLFAEHGRAEIHCET